MFIDSHAHLDITFFEKNDPYNDISELFDNYLELIIHISLDAYEFKKNYPLLNQYPKIKYASGIYPDRITEKNFNQQLQLDELRLILTTYKHVALGEIGIDLKYESYGSLDQQKLLFIQQLELARELNLPVIIHSRESFYECYKILENFRDLTIIFHCFSYGLEEANLILKQNNTYISFAGILTYKKSISLQEVAKTIPLEHIIFETDSPYLSPEPIRSKRNSPCHVSYIYEYFAKLRNIPLEELESQIRHNIFSAFKL